MNTTLGPNVMSNRVIAHGKTAENWLDYGAVQLTAPIEELLKRWELERLLTPLDRHFALEMAQLHPKDQQDPLFILLCALLSQQLSSQHSCLVLAHLVPLNPLAEQYSHCKLTLSLEALNDRLQTFDAVGHAGSNKPLILDNGRLYLQRYYQFETKVAAALVRLSQQSSLENEQDPSRNLGPYLDQLFPSIQEKNAIDWQKVATATALGKKLAVITGGPGTGKTTTVTKLLLLQQMLKLREIRLVAPTGKAAARLSESIKASKTRLAKELLTLTLPQMTAAANTKSTANLTDNEALLRALAQIPEEASTLHRLLGVIPNSTQFRHHLGNPLRLDLLIVDEASMVDLPMMYKLLSALPEHASLILLGDQDQLASVEAGAVLADICAGLKREDAPYGEQGIPWQMRYSKEQANRLSQLTGFDLSPYISDSPKLGDSLCMLMHSHRFKGDAGIGLLASAVNRSDLQGILAVWQRGFAELNWLEHGMELNATQAKISEPENNSGLNALLEQAVSLYGNYLSPLLQGARPSTFDIIESFNQYRILCAMRSGNYGVEGINSYVTLALTKAKLIQPQQEFYLGRPIIIQSNDYNLGLFNGDIGLILPDEDKPERLMAHFIKADGSQLKVLPARLPRHETCYAMTVHKSQGSEFNRVALVLPPNPQPSPVAATHQGISLHGHYPRKSAFYLPRHPTRFRACQQPNHPKGIWPCR
ncbi:exodeoxyribonuclease V subunit alpha [Shewanella sp. HN-41]|uniref:exodeoxyribonuclease V subunit alpha n=1 Tax=Shewanella sp. HN-41 TaxID=327275 RepID=UPI0002125914|nr:exodeoxyribonuclease V alpha chain RecD [Shewanella sp. HN-41]